MIDEMQETIDEQKQKIDEMQQQGIRNAIKILQDLKIPEQEIRMRICSQYQIGEEQVREFLG